MDGTSDLDLSNLQSRTFCDPAFSSRILNGLNELRLAEKFFDMTICVGEQSFMCHRVVLASASDYFRGMFGGMLRESFTDKVTIFDVDPFIMKQLMEFCYTGSVEIRTENVERLLRAADLFQFPTIKHACCQFLTDCLHPTNSLNIERFADEMLCYELAEASFNYTLRHIVEVAQVPDFMDLEFGKIMEVISHQNLNVDKEEHAYEIALFWIKADVFSRMQFFDRLMEHIRFPFMRRIYILTKVETNVLIRNSRMCLSFLKESRRLHNCELDRHEEPSVRMQPRPSTGIAEVLVVVGGLDGNCDELASNECLNPLTNHCRYLAECPDAVRGGFSAAVLDNDIYVTGGSDGFQTFNKAWRYKSQLNEWSDLPPMVRPREYHTSVALGMSLYVVSEEGCERYDLATNSWSEVSAMPHPVNNCSAAACHGHIYLIGSSAADDGIVTQKYDPVTDLWTILECDLTPVDDSVFVPSITALSGRLYFIHEDSKSVIAYDPIKDLWSDRIAPMLQVHLGGCVTQYQGKIVASGGYDKQFGLSDLVEVYDPTKNEWSVLAKLPQPMFWHSCVSIFRYVSAPRGDSFHAPLTLHNFSETLGVQGAKEKVYHRVGNDLV